MHIYYIYDALVNTQATYKHKFPRLCVRGSKKSLEKHTQALLAARRDRRPWSWFFRKNLQKQSVTL